MRRRGGGEEGEEEEGKRGGGEEGRGGGEGRRGGGEGRRGGGEEGRRKGRGGRPNMYLIIRERSEVTRLHVPSSMAARKTHYKNYLISTLILFNKTNKNTREMIIIISMRERKR